MQVEYRNVPIDHGSLSVVRTRRADQAKAAVLLIHGFAQNCHAWDLPGRSFSQFLASQDFDVFNLELRGHGRSRDLGAPLPESFLDHVERDVPASLDLIQRAGHDRVFLIGHSLGGAISYAVASSWPARVRGVVTLSGVFRWGGAGRWLRRMIKVVRSGAWAGKVVGLSGPNVRLDLLGRLYAQHLQRTGDDRLPVPIQGWYPGSMEPAVLDHWLRMSLDRTSGAMLSLMTTWATSGDFCSSVGGRDYAQLWRQCGVPVLVCAADRDRLAHPVKDVKPAFDESTATDRSYRCFGRERDSCAFGHVDLVLGKQAPSLVWPFVANWLHSR